MYTKGGYTFSPGDMPHPRVFRNVLSPGECDSLVQFTLGKMVDSELGVNDIDHTLRKSKTMWSEPEDHPVAHKIRRFSDRVSPKGTPESIQIVRYGPGGHYKPHYDADETPNNNQRLSTLIVYLTDNFIGGETHFPNIDFTMKPRKGDALLFYNVDPKNRCLFENSLHAGKPVISGAKYIANQWVLHKPMATVGICSVVKNPIDFDVWLNANRRFGISKFYICFESTPPNAVANDVYIEIGKSAGYNEHVNVQERQNKWTNKVLKLAKKDGIDFLIHIDSDEILHGDINIIKKLPSHQRTFWFQNYEALFPKDHTTNGRCFKATSFVDCSKGQCVSYANGKGGARVADDVSAWGPHRFQSSQEQDETAVLKGVIVKHFESCLYEKFVDKFQNLQGSVDVPFGYYKEAIDAVKSGDKQKQLAVYKKYRIRQLL